MRRPPRPPQEPFLTRARLLRLFVQGTFIAMITLLAFLYCLYGMDLSLDRARTLTFTVMVTAQLFHALNNRSEDRSIFALGLWTNKPLLATVGLSALLQVGIVSWPPIQGIFKVVPFDPEHWVLAIGIGTLPLVAMEIWKRAKKNADR